MEWMRRRCYKKGSGATFFRGARVEKRDLRGAKEAINGKGSKRSESEDNKVKKDEKVNMSRKTRNETKNTKDKKRVDSDMKKGKESARIWERITQIIKERGKGKSEECKK